MGNAAFADYVTSQAGGTYRVTHLDDPIPRLPPILLGYRHTSPEYWLSDGLPTTTNYTINDVKVCVGDANVSCNAATTGFDIVSHLNYFETISACAPDLTFKRDDAGVQQLQEMFMTLDVAYATAMQTSTGSNNSASRV